MSVDVSFDTDEGAIADMATSPDIMGALVDCAEAIGALAREYCVQHIAPTIEILEIDDRNGVVYVGSQSSFAHLWEFGSIKTPTLAYMRRAAYDIAERFEGG